MEHPPKKFHRLAPGFMVRLKSAYIVKCDKFFKDERGNIKEIHCSCIHESRSGNDTSGISVKGTIQWISVKHAVSATVNLYDRLFKVENPDDAEGDFKDYINPDSLHQIEKAFVEPDLKNASHGSHYQFIRKGYFCLDKDSTEETLIFNRAVNLKDSWKG